MSSVKGRFSVVAKATLGYCLSECAGLDPAQILTGDTKLEFQVVFTDIKRLIPLYLFIYLFPTKNVIILVSL